MRAAPAAAAAGRLGLEPARRDRAAVRHPVPPAPQVQDELACSGHLLLPTQLPPRRRACTGPPALFAALVAGALEDAGLGPRRASLPRTSAAYRRLAERQAASRQGLALAWLCGHLDREVALPVEVACAALGLDPAALAAAVRRADRRAAVPAIRGR